MHLFSLGFIGNMYVRYGKGSLFRYWKRKCWQKYISIFLWRATSGLITGMKFKCVVKSA